MRQHWLLDPNVTFLNHGSFGATPIAVLEAQTEWRRRMERSPVQFMRALPARLAEVRQQIAPFVGSAPEDLAFVRNATEGVGSVLRSLSLQPGDELLTTNHTYGACANALRFVAERSGATVRVVDIPFPLNASAEVVELISRGVNPRTRLALIDHVTSATGLVFPITNIVRVLRDLGVETLVDGAHAPGMLDLNIEAIGAAYYAGNFHKWMCAPKGAGLLWVRSDLHTRVFPPTISHGLSAPLESRFLALFDWTGTFDPSALLSVPDAMRVMADLVPGGWKQVQKRNHELALRARDILCAALGIRPPAPDNMLGALVAVPLPATPSSGAPSSGAPSSASGQTSDEDAEPQLQLYEQLVERGYETLVHHWPAPPQRVLRVSAQLYNTPDDYLHLASVLKELLPL